MTTATATLSSIHYAFYAHAEYVDLAADIGKLLHKLGREPVGADLLEQNTQQAQNPGFSLFTPPGGGLTWFRRSNHDCIAFLTECHDGGDRWKTWLVEEEDFARTSATHAYGHERVIYVDFVPLSSRKREIQQQARYCLRGVVAASERLAFTINNDRVGLARADARTWIVVAPGDDNGTAARLLFTLDRGLLVPSLLTANALRRGAEEISGELHRLDERRATVSLDSWQSYARKALFELEPWVQRARADEDLAVSLWFAPEEWKNEIKRLVADAEERMEQLRTALAHTKPSANGSCTKSSTQLENAMSTNPVALLITAVGSERKAVLDFLRDDHGVSLSREEIEGRYYNRFSWPGRGRTWDVLLGQPTEKGGPAAQALLQDFTKMHRPELVLMVGMCGGLPENGAKEGMVILGRQVFNYEPARLREGVSVWSPTGYRSTARVLDLANALAAEGELGAIEVKTTKDYASGAKLIDDLSSELRQKILAFSGDILGFEMEGPDTLHAVWELQRTMHFDVAVAKGVSDFGDGKQREDKDSRQRIATRNAAQVALKLVSAY